MAIDVERLSDRQLLTLISNHQDRHDTASELYADATRELVRRRTIHPGLSLKLWRRQLARYLRNAVAAIAILMVLIWFTMFFAGIPIVGLVTGQLSIPGKQGGVGVEIGPPWALPIAAALLLFYIFAARSMLRQFNRQYGPQGMRRLLYGLIGAACLVGLMLLGVAQDPS